MKNPKMVRLPREDIGNKEEVKQDEAENSTFNQNSKEVLTEYGSLPDLVNFNNYDTHAQSEFSNTLRSVKTVEPSNIKVVLLRESKFKKYLFAPILTILTCGFAFIFAEWYSSFMRFFLYCDATNEEDATDLFIEETREETADVNEDGIKEKVNVIETDIINIKTKIGPLCKFQYKYTPFFYNVNEGIVKKIEYNYERKFKNLRNLKAGISECDYDDLLSLYGSCKMELIIDPWYRILIRDTLNAYYLYQIMGLTVWYISGYYKYATLIVVLMVYSVYTEYYDLKESMEKLRKIARYE